MDEEIKTHWKSTCDYKHLGSYSLAPSNQDVILTITHVNQNVEIDSDQGKKLCKVAYFKERADWIKPMILNKTNMKTLEKLYSPYIEDWRNIRVKIGVSKIKAFGEMLDALRIRPVIPPTEKAFLVPDTEEWKGAIHHMKNEGVTVERIKGKYNITPENEALLIELTTKEEES
jgi:hypothetical protein